MAYAPAFEVQRQAVDRVLAAREAGVTEPTLARSVGIVYLVEHDPVVTISNRAGAMDHLVAAPDLLAREGVGVERTDRGGDITYHGPGQLVAYPILDLNLLNLGLHAYMRLLEESVLRTCAAFGVPCTRDPSATGVWTTRGPDNADDPGSIDGLDAAAIDAASCARLPHAKIAAMGVRVRKWVSMHGLAINVTTNLDHFRLIVPCGLVGRPVTSLRAELAERCPSMDDVKHTLIDALRRLVDDAYSKAALARANA